MQNAKSKIKEEMDSGCVGYYKLPKDSLGMVESAKSIKLNGIKQIVVIGVGGSLLGIKAIDSILRPITPHAKEMLFFENSDPLSISSTISKIIKDEACFFLISKSGLTIEATSIFKTLIKQFDLELDNAKNIFVITDEGSVLSHFANHHNIAQFNVAQNVGGRFSVLSAVGVVPLQVAGYDMAKVLNGAGEFLDSFFGADEDYLLKKACYIYENSKNKNINVVFSYADCLENLTKWYIQLWGESLGKVDKKGQNVGITPVSLIGAIDQHSFLQLVIEGPKDKTMTFINIEDFSNDLSIPDITLKYIEKTDFVNKQSFNTLINEQCKATMQSVLESGVDADSITLDKISEQNTGAIIIYYELLTSLVGAMLDIDTYNQPGVELGKTILYRSFGDKKEDN
jgi:glucose-6-phosphate isomerase